jgi:membrane protein required for colicin V production
MSLQTLQPFAPAAIVPLVFLDRALRRRALRLGGPEETGVNFVLGGITLFSNGVTVGLFALFYQAVANEVALVRIPSLPFEFLLAVVLVSAILAMIRGFTREVFSIASWVVAAVATYMLWQDVLPFTQQYVDDRHVSLGVTVIGIFFVTLLVVSLVTMKISDFILDSKVGPLDRTLGFLFGAARGVILVVIAVMFVNFFIASERQPAWIAQAASKPWLDSIGTDLMNALPDDPEAQILERFRADDAERSGVPGLAEDGFPPEEP